MQHRGNYGRGTERYEQEEDDFGQQEQWQEEQFDERVSVASSRVNDSTYRGGDRYSKSPQQQEDAGHSREYESGGYQGYQDYQDDNSEYNDGTEIEEIVEEAVEEVGDLDPEARKDFHSAYQQLVEKVSHDPTHRDLLLNQDEFDKVHRLKEMKKNLKTRTGERVKEFEENKRKKIELLEQERQKKEMEECTFKPMTYSRPGQRRNLEKFLDDQRRHEEVKQMKKNMILEEENRDEGREVHHPQICAGSAKILAQKDHDDAPVHERLYGISKEKMQKNIQQMMETPTSNISLDNTQHSVQLEQ